MEQTRATSSLLYHLKGRIGRLGQPAKAADRAVIPFGIGAIDTRLPGGGLALGALHEVSGGGPDVEHGASAALLIGGILARQPGQVLWVVERADLFAPALDAVGLSPDRVIYAEAGKAKAVLTAMEEGLRHAGLAGVVGELSGRLTLIASRRLQLAAEHSGVICFALRRSRNHDDPALAEPTAATRWRVSALPSPPPLLHAPETPGLARAVATGPSAVSRRRAGKLDRGGKRCDGSSRSSCRPGRPTGCGASRAPPCRRRISRW